MKEWFWRIKIASRFSYLHHLPPPVFLVSVRPCMILLCLLVIVPPASFPSHFPSHSVDWNVRGAKTERVYTDSVCLPFSEGRKAYWYFHTSCVLIFCRHLKINIFSYWSTNPEISLFVGKAQECGGARALFPPAARPADVT